MNKKQKMTEQIRNHGMNLNAIFNLDIDPIALSKKVRRLEVKAHRLAEDYCNGLIESSDWLDTKEKQVLKSLDKLLGFSKLGIPVIMNSDPRGYALKIDDEYIRDNSLNIYRDFGGYGILAPEFDGN